MATGGLLYSAMQPAQDVQSLLGSNAGGRSSDQGGGSRLPVNQTAAAGAPRPGPPAGAPTRAGAQQFKAGFVRKWMVVDREGKASVFQPHKLEITHQMGVQLRDLR